MSRVKCTKCKEMRPVSWFHGSKSGKERTSYYCKSCVNTKRSEIHYKKEKFKRNPSPCDSRLADKALANELKEVWEME